MASGWSKTLTLKQSDRLSPLSRHAFGWRRGASCLCGSAVNLPSVQMPRGASYAKPLQRCGRATANSDRSRHGRQSPRLAQDRSNGEISDYLHSCDGFDKLERTGAIVEKTDFHVRAEAAGSDTCVAKTCAEIRDDALVKRLREFGTRRVREAGTPSVARRRRRQSLPRFAGSTLGAREQLDKVSRF
jgi:hypothetical protein